MHGEMKDYINQFANMLFNVAAFTLKKGTIKSVEMTPYKIWNGMTKPFSLFLTFGNKRHK